MDLSKSRPDIKNSEALDNPTYGELPPSYSILFGSYVHIRRDSQPPEYDCIKSDNITDINIWCIFHQLSGYYLLFLSRKIMLFLTKYMYSICNTDHVDSDWLQPATKGWCLRNSNSRISRKFLKCDTVYFYVVFHRWIKYYLCGMFMRYMPISQLATSWLWDNDQIMYLFG